jgi:hypothetical protein
MCCANRSGRLCRAALEVCDCNNLQLLRWTPPAPVSLVGGLFVEPVKDPVQLLEGECAAIVVPGHGPTGKFRAVLGNLPQIAFGHAKDHSGLDCRKLAKALTVFGRIFERHDFLLGNLANIGPVAEALLQARKFHIPSSLCAS